MASESLRKAQREDKFMVFESSEGRSFRLPHAFLRAGSPSAENTHYDSEYLEIDKLKAATERFSEIQIKGIERVGNYALRIVFSDGHKTGIYSFRHLFELEKIFKEKF